LAETSTAGLLVAPAPLDDPPELSAPHWRNFCREPLGRESLFLLKSCRSVFYFLVLILLPPTAPHMSGRHEYNGVLPSALGGLLSTLTKFHPNGTQPLAWCLTPWLRWTIALFAIFPYFTPLCDEDARVGFWSGAFFILPGLQYTHLARAFMDALRKLFRDTITVVSCDQHASLALTHMTYRELWSVKFLGDTLTQLKDWREYFCILQEPRCVYLNYLQRWNSGEHFQCLL
jgi:hypothetical protein